MGTPWRLHGRSVGAPWGLGGGSVSIALAVASRSSIARTLHKVLLPKIPRFGFVAGSLIVRRPFGFDRHFSRGLIFLCQVCFC